MKRSLLEFFADPDHAVDRMNHSSYGGAGSLVILYVNSYGSISLTLLFDLNR